MVSHVEPAGEDAQSAFVAQPTQFPEAVSHAFAYGSLAQSVFDVQALTHVPPNGLLSAHRLPVPQSDLLLQPQLLPWPKPGSTHSGPPAAVAQSALALHPHVCLTVSHTGPRGFVAQSAVARHWTQAPDVVSHAGPVGLPAQSALDAQRLAHCRTGPVCVWAQ